MVKLTAMSIVALLSLAVCAAKVCEWPQLPGGTLPDTEITTNIPLRVNVERLDVFSLRLQVVDTNASEVLVAFGHDIDESDGSPWTEGNVVLPLSGASIDAVFESDFTVYATAMANLAATSGPLERQTPNFGVRWFNNDGAADYRGRVDNAVWQTVWRYNQIDELSGFGAVATLYGAPARASKLGNFFAGYGTRILGVWGISRWLSQQIGTDNDETAEMSWDAGTDVADGSNLTARVAMLSTNMWSVSDAKVRTLWPNPAATDNHVVAPTNRVDYNFFFRSPGVVEWNVCP